MGGHDSNQLAKLVVNRWYLSCLYQDREIPLKRCSKCQASTVFYVVSLSERQLVAEGQAGKDIFGLDEETANALH
jgi:hypothetical protein